MVTSTSRLAYSDCFDLLNQAVTDPQGIRLKFSDRGSAVHFRLRLHMARRIDRSDNVDTYPRDHVLFGRSVYDELIIRMRQDKDDWWLYLERTTAAKFEVESLSNLNEPEFEAIEPIPPTLEEAGITSIRRRL